MKIRVYYEDTDMGGVVYHSNYLNFCERARSELFFAKGTTPLFEGGHFVVRRIEADFRASAKLGDLLDVETELLEIRRASLSMRQKIFRDDTLLFEITLKLAYLTTEGKIATLDAGKQERLKGLLGG